MRRPYAAAWLSRLERARRPALAALWTVGLTAGLAAMAPGRLTAARPYRPRRSCLVCNLQPPLPPIYVPAIFLYPPVRERVRVRVDATVTRSRPAYGHGWTVTAWPGGRLSTGGDQLDYDALTPPIWQTAAAWVVPAVAWPRWIRTELPRLGLNAQEVAAFYADWARSLPRARYYLVAPQPQGVVDRAVPLVIRPRPQTLYRLWLDIVPLSRPAPVRPPQVPVLVRRGFTVVEWGVVLPPAAAPAG